MLTANFPILAPSLPVAERGRSASSRWNVNSSKAFLPGGRTYPGKPRRRKYIGLPTAQAVDLSKYNYLELPWVDT